MTELFKETRFWTRPPTDREASAWRAVLDSFGREHVVSRTVVSGVDAAVYPDDFDTGSFVRATEIPGAYDIDVAFYGAGEPDCTNRLKAVHRWVESHELGHIRVWFGAEPVKTEPLPDEVANLYVSLFKALHPHPQPEPVVEVEETVDWEFMVRAPRPLRSGRIKVRLRNKGRAKPRRDDTPWD